MKTYIIGHKNPDTDSIVSAIALSTLEKKLGEEYIPARAGEINRETEYVLNRFGFDDPELVPIGEKEVILVDHNEPSQIHENINHDEIKTIFDHHKLGGLATKKPISIRIKPVGSTSTIIAGIFGNKNIVPSKEVAGILISGIISDTLNFTSPTSTEKDRKTLEKLNEIAGLDVKDLADEMFRAKSDIKGMKISEIISGDYKVFDMKGKKVGIGVSETVLPDSILEKKEEIIQALKEKRGEEKIDLIFYAVVDIINQYSVLFVPDKEEIDVAEKAFGTVVNKNIATLQGVVSRKKQITPQITSVVG